MTTSIGSVTLDEFEEILLNEFQTNDICVICNFEVASGLTKRIFNWNDKIEAESVTLVSPEIDGNDGTYLVATLDKCLFVEQARSKEGTALWIGNDENNVYFDVGIASDVFDAIDSNSIVLYDIQN